MVMLRHLAVSVLAGALLGCGPSGEPTLVAQEFWAARQDGDIARAEQHVTEQSVGALQYQHDAGPSIDGVSLEETRIEGDEAFVVTRVIDRSNREPAELSFETVLVVEDRTWKVDVDRTLDAMLKSVAGDPAGQFQAQVEQAMTQRMEDAMRAMERDMRQAPPGVREAMRNARQAARQRR